MANFTDHIRDIITEFDRNEADRIGYNLIRFHYLSYARNKYIFLQPGSCIFSFIYLKPPLGCIRNQSTKDCPQLHSIVTVVV